MSRLKAAAMWTLIGLAAALTVLGWLGGHSTLFPMVCIGFAFWLRESIAHDRTKAHLAKLAQAGDRLSAALHARR